MRSSAVPVPATSKMAAPICRLLMSKQSSLGSAIGAFSRRSPFFRSPQTPRSLNTGSGSGAKPELPGPAYEGPEYIPKRKAKNPMKKVGLAWVIGFPSGIILFLLAKREVDKRRLEQLKVRQRMKDSNQGAYERERFNSAP